MKNTKVEATHNSVSNEKDLIIEEAMLKLVSGGGNICNVNWCSIDGRDLCSTNICHIDNIRQP
ncbi:hypothetical protein QWY20_02925 [Alkalimonas sp. MEB108]|uniref:Lantibiotic n=1 Tax=Alkalimonas cellulosilytica TaxID=3058395 RepID=A0ABU7J1W1_9GAMM|nr:hypothetical protein [Alkalimonas sp. MEB108]MEE2000394.1 hypothetical protein [Alkalimonas sp. MEB108]